MNETLTAVPGLLVGHAQNGDAGTGCTVVLYEAGAVGGVDQRGGAPGTRETDALAPMRLVDRVHAVLLTGGSAFGLDAATGVVRYLEERGAGFETDYGKVPVVPAAVLFDLGYKDARVRPDAAMGYQACLRAAGTPVAEGSVGAGAGATVAKILGMDRAVKSGVGSYAVDLGEGLIVGALAAVNAVGDVIDPETGETLAGPRDPESGRFLNSLEILRSPGARRTPAPPPGQNTVIGVVATNASLTKEGANKMAQMAQDGLARAVRPAHTMMDGDTIFALATGGQAAGGSPLEISMIGAFAAEAFAMASARAIRAAGGPA